MKERENYQELRHALTQYVEANHSIENFTWAEKGGAPSSEVSAWERKHGQLLPDELRDFYLLWDGVTCRWDVCAHGREVIPLGCMCVNSLSQLTPVDAACLCDERDELRPELPPAATSAGLAAFDLDAHCESGRVLLLLGVVGTPRRAEVWFQDVSCGLTRLAGSFGGYFRLLALSLGLPRWQYAYTEAGLDPDARRWHRLLAPPPLAAGSGGLGGLSSSLGGGLGVSKRPAADASALDESTRALQGATLPSHAEGLLMLQQLQAGVGARARPVAAGAPRSAVALLNSGAGTSAGLVGLLSGGGGGGRVCSRNSSATSTSSSVTSGSHSIQHEAGPHVGTGRPSSAHEATGGGGTRRRRAVGGTRLSKKASAHGEHQTAPPEADE